VSDPRPGAPATPRRRFSIVAARYNEVITTKLVDGAIEGLRAAGHGDEDVDLTWVPGAFEIPLVAHRLAQSGRYSALICLGAIIRGETAHFDLIATEVARGIAEASRATGIPIIFEVLATQDLPQAEARAGGAHGNKGWEAAKAAVEMAEVMESLP
jgi:6,7-dimethyl-8-ribityllumazine synthase